MAFDEVTNKKGKDNPRDRAKNKKQRFNSIDNENEYGVEKDNAKACNPRRGHFQLCNEVRWCSSTCQKATFPKW